MQWPQGGLLRFCFVDPQLHNSLGAGASGGGGGIWEALGPTLQL